MSEEKAIAVADHLAEGCSLKATGRLAKVHPSVVRRLNGKVGLHAEAFHAERVQDLDVIALEADERHGYAQDKSQPPWEAEVIDPVSKFVISPVQGPRDEVLIRRLLEDAAGCISRKFRLSSSTPTLIEGVVKNSSANHQHLLSGIAAPAHPGASQARLELFNAAFHGA